MSHITQHAFAKNRAEELGFDIWDEFVVPLFFDKLALDEIRKPMLIEGGRGCGKTTLLRYLSHATQLSPKRHLTRDVLPKQIGLYLRADTQYLRTFCGDALSDTQWLRAYEHSLCLMVLGELISALELMSRGQQRKEEFPGISEIDLCVLRDFDPEAGKSIADVIEFVRKRKNQLALWLNNIDVDNAPKFLPLKTVILAVIEVIRKSTDFMAKMDFFVFIDEYENLLPYQMKFINTILKHSEPPLIFHIATKRHGMTLRETQSSEQLQEPADFRRFDVEAELSEDFRQFAAELFCFRLLKSNADIGDVPVSNEVLCDMQHLQMRRTDKDYRNKTQATVAKLLPGLSNSEMADHILGDNDLRERLEKLIGVLLKKRDQSLSADQFIRTRAAMASICVIPLLHQGKSAKDILRELDLCEQGKTSKFKTAEWIHHYFLASVFQLYLPLQRPCELYAGFEAFLKLSSNNVRHFLELCHLSMVEYGRDLKPGDAIPITHQATAARSASALFVKESQGSGDHGNRLFLVVNTLGQIFRLSQQRPSQSEPERTHFSIDRKQTADTVDNILKECVKWSVLFANKETKIKKPQLEAEEYVLNPIYAPYFGISYNKGRKLELSEPSAIALLTGNREQLASLIKQYEAQWSDSDGAQQQLL